LWEGILSEFSTGCGADWIGWEIRQLQTNRSDRLFETQPLVHCAALAIREKPLKWFRFNARTTFIEAPLIPNLKVGENEILSL